MENTINTYKYKYSKLIKNIMIISLILLSANIIYILLRLFEFFDLHTSSITLDCIFIGLSVIAMIFVAIIFSIKYSIKNNCITMKTGINTLLIIEIANISKIVLANEKMFIDVLYKDSPKIVNINIYAKHFDSFINNIKQVNPQLLVEIYNDNNQN